MDKTPQSTVAEQEAADLAGPEDEERDWLKEDYRASELYQLAEPNYFGRLKAILIGFAAIAAVIGGWIGLGLLVGTLTGWPLSAGMIALVFAALFVGTANSIGKRIIERRRIGYYFGIFG